MKHYIENYLLPVIFIFINLVSLIIGLSLNGISFINNILALLFVSGISFIFLIIKKLYKYEFNIIFQYLFVFHIYGSIVLGTCFKLYSLIYVWDLLMHGLFGFNMMFLFSIIYNKNNFLLFSFSTLGIGSLWEIFEYLYDLIFKKDTQRINESISLNKLPQADIMEDLIITIFGIILYILIYYLKIYFKKLKDNKK